MRGLMHSLAALLASLLVAALWPSSAGAQAGSSSPDQLRAAIVYNIVRFVEFPEQRGKQLNMCVVRSVEGASHLLALNGQRVGTRTIAARPVESTPGNGCDVVYLGRASSAETARASRRGVLVMGEAPSFITSGGTVGLVRMGKQIRFEVNARNAREAGLSISSKLLRLAARVQQ